MVNILEKINSEIAEVKKHKGYNVILKIKMNDGEILRFNIGNGVWDTEPTEENGVLTIRNNKEFAEKTSSQASEELTTTYTFERTNLEVSSISSFRITYSRDVIQKIATENE